jgi:hypothetical protein
MLNLSDDRLSFCHRQPSATNTRGDNDIIPFYPTDDLGVVRMGDPLHRTA